MTECRRRRTVIIFGENLYVRLGLNKAYESMSLTHGLEQFLGAVCGLCPIRVVSGRRITCCHNHLFSCTPLSEVLHASILKRQGNNNISSYPYCVIVLEIGQRGIVNYLTSNSESWRHKRGTRGSSTWVV